DWLRADSLISRFVSIPRNEFLGYSRIVPNGTEETGFGRGRASEETGVRRQRCVYWVGPWSRQGTDDNSPGRQSWER
ncbi:MAG: hypothetical protein ACREDR_20290, partial [Blastocatellia bacterium]